MERILHRAGQLNVREVEALGEARDQLRFTKAASRFGFGAGGSARHTARVAREAPAVAERVARSSGRKAALNLACREFPSLPGVVSPYALYDAVLATLVADLTGRGGLTAEHLKLLRDPWRQVIGASWETPSDG